MAETLVEKKVLFSGIWRPRYTVDDYFLRTVSRQFQEKPGAPAAWRLTTEGLTIVAQRTEGGGGRQGQTDQIPVQAIKEVTVNRYNGLCLMTLFVDAAQRYNALVCRCQTEQDAAHIVQVFRRLQKSLSGEGYRIDLKQPQGINWTLKTKQNGDKQAEESVGNPHQQHPDHLGKNPDGGGTMAFSYHHHQYHNNNQGEALVVEMEEETLEREPLDVEGRPCFNVGVQADLTADDDSVSTTSETSYQSLKDELETLSNEVRDIKILLEQTTGISAEEFFRRRRDPNAPVLVPVKRLSSQDSEGGEPGNGEKRVAFASLPGEGGDQDEDMDFDIRSVGMQTMEEGSKRGKYQKRVRNVLTPNRYQQHSYRSRSDSSSSSQPSPGPLSPQSPSAINDGSVFTYSAHGQRYGEPRRHPRSGSGSLSKVSVYGSSGTVMRPIESVYHAQPTGFKQKRRQVIVLPARSASMPRHLRRMPSDTVNLVGDKVPAPQNPAQNGAF